MTAAPTARRPRGLAAVLAAVALAGAAPRAAADETPVVVSVGEADALDLPAVELVEEYARLNGRPVHVDPQATGVVVRFVQDAELDLATLTRVLRLHRVVLVEGADDLLAAYHQQNLAQELPPADGPVITGAPPEENRLVTAVVPVRHGAGNSIFAVLRGVMTRDTDRIGNILYVQGPEVIVICDLAPKVAYYRRLLAQLDVPAGDGRDLNVYRLAHAAAVDVARLLEDALGGAVGPGPAGGAGLRIVPDPRTNSILVDAPEGTLGLVEAVVEKLDVRVAAAPPTSFEAWVLEVPVARVEAVVARLRAAPAEAGSLGGVEAEAVVLEHAAGLEAPFELHAGGQELPEFRVARLSLAVTAPTPAEPQVVVELAVAQAFDSGRGVERSASFTLACAPGQDATRVVTCSGRTGHELVLVLVTR